MKINISAAVLTRGNKNLTKLKKSLDFCDEVIVITNNQIDDFAKARNDALEKVKNKWVLFIDDDEEVSKVLSLEIESTLKSPDSPYSGFYIHRKNYFLGSYVGSDEILRLAKKGSGKWERRVHETWVIKGKVGYLRNPLIHNSVGSVSEMINKINLYSTLHAQANLKEGKKSSIFKIMIFPKLKFIESIFTGRGFVFSLLQSFHSFLSWSKQWKLQKDLT